jgi:hypothetical protein
VTIRAGEPVTATATLTRAGRRLARETAHMARGTHTLRVTIPQRVKAGAARLALRLTDADGNGKTYHRTVHIHRRAG